MQMHSATKCLGEWRRSDGLARGEAGSGRESARASAFCFGGILNGKRNTKMLKSFYERF